VTVSRVRTITVTMLQVQRITRGVVVQVRKITRAVARVRYFTRLSGSKGDSDEKGDNTKS
jgi:hypothetical protein